jgi:predicted outer membrane repeat protein
MKRRVRYLSRLILSAIFILCVVLFFRNKPGWSRTIYFPSSYLSTIQSAIDLSRDGDTVLVAPGIYYENLDFKGKKVFLASHFILEFDTSMIEKTIIDGSRPEISSRGSVVRFVSGECSGSVIRGFTLRNGTGSALDEFGYGGGIFCYLSAPQIINNRIENNEAHFGGGIACFYGDSVPRIISNLILKNRGIIGAGVFSQGINPLIQNNRIENNSSSYRGGGIFFKLCSPKIRGNIVSQNTAADYGGGIYALATSGEIVDNWLKGNRAESKGGGIHISSQSSAKITGNIIESNYADLGGGLYNLYSNNFVASNTFIDNKASEGSGAIFCSGTSPDLPRIINNIFYLNQGGIDCSQGCLPQISYNDFWSNSGSNLVCGNQGLGDTSWGVNLNNTACDSFFNIFSDPLFADSSYNLSCSSPCIDAGDSVFSTYERIRNDIGAREYLYLSGDANADGRRDLMDVVILINCLFKTKPYPCPWQSGDANADGEISLLDVVALLHSILK